MFEFHKTSLVLQQSSSVIVHAPVKINLALHVVGRRPDGYHLLESLVAFSPDGDDLEIEQADCDSFSVSGPFATSLGSDSDNLVIKARDALRSASGGSFGPVAIRLVKKLPVSSGLGGGSCDAAATLAGLQALMPTRFGPVALLRCAPTLGADVLMCLAGIYQKSALLVRGIGEDIETLSDFPVLHLVLLNSGIAVSTPKVFARLERRQNAPLIFKRNAIFSFDHLTSVLQNARNDLYEPARCIVPELEEMLKLLRKSGARVARMSGSGATCFGLYRSFTQTRKAAEEIARHYPGYFVLATTTFGKFEKMPHDKINESSF
ncbi:MAG: 4-diphosphocytidyl-2-C-methyl-D-erythritol kinase [Candidatus Tokpelaia sp. JSC189]|nr:MAG: 4-diphosphocytidyl-2-C-methyl-D-erythritol kinase [Candidatus Tokpelaia sp. JSC189]